MPRRPRVHIEGSYQHVILRGNGGAEIFLDDDDRRSFLACLDEAGRRSRWRLMSYCLMSNHVHLMIRVGEYAISDAMHMLATTHATRFNAVHGRFGHRFGERYKALHLEREAHLVETFRYIALNPWRANVTPDRHSWRWSAHPALLGNIPAPPMLDRDLTLSFFDGEPALYREFISSGERRPKPKSLAALAREGRDQIADAHLIHGFTQKQIAEAFGVSQTTVFRRIREASSHETVSKGAQ